MSEFSATDAGMAGFAVTRNRPTVVGAWVVVMVVVNLITTVLIAALAGPSLAALNNLGQAEIEANPTRVFELLAAIAPAGLATIPVSLVAYGVVYVALYRAILTPGASGPAFTLGAPELRQIGVMVLQFLALGGIYMATVIVMVGAVSILGALGAYLLGFVFSIIVGLLAFVIYGALAFVIGGPEGVANATGSQMTDIASVFTPLSLLYVVFAGVLSAFTGILMSAPAADIYRQLAPDASTFD